MIVGFSLEHVEADKKLAKKGNMNVNYTHKITDVEEASVPAIDEPIARVRFTFNISYLQNEETVADIDFDGAVLWQKDAEELVNAWEQDSSLDEDVSATLANHIYRKCLTQAVGLADTLDMPSPVPMPNINRK